MVLAGPWWGWDEGGCSGRWAVLAEFPSPVCTSWGVIFLREKSAVPGNHRLKTPTPSKASPTFCLLRIILLRPRNESIWEQVFEEQFFLVICLTRHISHHLSMFLEQLWQVLFQNSLRSCPGSAAVESALSSWRLYDLLHGRPKGTDDF